MWVPRAWGSWLTTIVPGAEIHVSGALLARDLHRGFHERAADAFTASVGHHVELGQVALERLHPDRFAEAQHGEPVRPGVGE
jgi:hypothetical protein